MFVTLKNKNQSKQETNVEKQINNETNNETNKETNKETNTETIKYISLKEKPTFKAAPTNNNLL